MRYRLEEAALILNRGDPFELRRERSESLLRVRRLVHPRSPEVANLLLVRPGRNSLVGGGHFIQGNDAIVGFLLDHLTDTPRLFRRRNRMRLKPFANREMEKIIPRRDRAIDELVEIILGGDRLSAGLLVQIGGPGFPATGN